MRRLSISSAVVMPLILSAVILIIDQGTKLLIVRFVEHYSVSRYAIPVIGDFLRIIHVSNTAIAFSIGRDLPVVVKRILFVVLPCLLMMGIVWYYLKVQIPRIQRWALALMIGGGLGNIIDRIARAGGVVDFIDVKMYGVFGFERWPTFNVADSSIVIGSITLLVSTFLFTVHEDSAAVKDGTTVASPSSTSADTYDE